MNESALKLLCSTTRIAVATSSMVESPDVVFPVQTDSVSTAACSCFRRDSLSDIPGESNDEPAVEKYALGTRLMHMQLMFSYFYNGC